MIKKEKEPDDIDLSDVDIKIEDKPTEYKEDKPIPARKSRKQKKPTYVSAKKHIVASSIDALYLESVNKLAKARGVSEISSTHDIGAAVFYAILYYAPDIPTEHPLTYLALALAGCGLDIVNIMTSPGETK